MKYCVSSNELQKVVSADSPEGAAQKALDLCVGETIGDYFYVDERGFREAAALHKFTMDQIIKTLGED